MTPAAACRPGDVVVTGLGTVNPLGGDVDSTWSALHEGTCAIRLLEHGWVENYELPVRIGAPLAINPADLLPPRQIRRLDRASQCALLAARHGSRPDPRGSARNAWRCPCPPAWGRSCRSWRRGTP